MDNLNVNLFHNVYSGGIDEREWFIFYCVKREEARIETNAIILGCLT